MLFYCFIVCFTRLSLCVCCGGVPIFSLKFRIFPLWASFRFWGVLVCFCVFVFCKVVWFSYKHLHFFYKVLHFSYKHLRFFYKVVRIFFKHLLRMFANFLLILVVWAFFHFWGFLWAWNLYTFRVDTIVRWYTNTGFVGFFFTCNCTFSIVKW